MTHYTAMEKINGTWRNTLIIITDAPTNFPAEIRFDEETSDGIITTIYPVVEALPVKEAGGKYYYWFVYNKSYILLNGENDGLSADLRDAETAIDILTGVAQ